ncbi:MAG: DNA-binding response regulator [Gammaproteobacteria bacterium]|nr:MAG: DNA-binding response regulator [Gammaproteobacteria bacterium]
MEERFKIIIIEHEENVRQGLVSVFEHHHFDVEATDNIAVGYEKARSGDFDLVLIDARAAGLNALEICAGIRCQHPGQVIFMLTADSCNQGLMTLGADDYSSVPFAYTDLVQRAKALLRRTRLQNKTGLTETIKIGEVTIDTANASGQCPQGKIAFTQREVRLLQYLCEQRGKTVEAHELLNQIWGYPRYLNTEIRAVEIHVASLIHKIEADVENPQYIQQVGEGACRIAF